MSTSQTAIRGILSGIVSHDHEVEMNAAAAENAIAGSRLNCERLQRNNDGNGNAHIAFAMTFDHTGSCHLRLIQLPADTNIHSL